MCTMMMDWDSDPELKAMKAEFTRSLAERRALLLPLIESLGDAGAAARVPAWLEEVRFIAHRLAGAAESYGYPTLTAIAEKLDDYFECDAALVTAAKVARYAALLAEALDASADGKDPAAFAGDPRMAELISAVESLPSEARRVSS